MAWRTPQSWWRRVSTTRASRRGYPPRWPRGCRRRARVARSSCALTSTRGMAWARRACRRTCSAPTSTPSFSGNSATRTSSTVPGRCGSRASSRLLAQGWVAGQHEERHIERGDPESESQGSGGVEERDLLPDCRIGAPFPESVNDDDHRLDYGPLLYRVDGRDGRADASWSGQKTERADASVPPRL